jgi:methionyl-tRNA synthetase
MRIVSSMMYPVMPDKMREMHDILGLPRGEPQYDGWKQWGGLEPGTKIGEMKSLFPRIKVDEASRSEGVEKKSRKTKSDSGSKETAMEIDYSDFEKIQLKTARIIKAERIEGADKLLRIDIEVGDEKRQIVAGIALHYKPEELAGKTIVVVANLKPAKIRGVDSNGMLLAAAADGKLRLLSVDGDLPSGAAVK